MRALRIFQFAALIILAALPSCNQDKKDKKNHTEVSGEHEAELTDAPFVPRRGSWDKPQKVIVHLEIRELESPIMDGTNYVYWTFGGKVPGKFIRINKGDLVEFHLSNHPSNKLPHNIDLHAVNGPGGGAEASLTAPGHTSVFSFRALNPGLYVYHCATAPVGMHIGNGMYGLIYVEDPDHPLPKVDREYYVMQGELYTKGAYGEHGLQIFSMENAIKEQPTYVVFNGHIGSLVGDKSLTAKVGETIRVFIGNAGPNLVSSFHIIGEIFDKVYPEGGLDLVNKNIQTTVVPAGGAAIVEFKVNVPGTYHMVDHSVFRAFNKGALGDITVTGDDNTEVYSHKQRDEVYMLEGSNIRNQELTTAPELKERSETERMELGKSLFMANCAACHQTDGKGLAGVFPPLAGSDYLKNRPDKGVNIVLHGLSETITVNGKIYNGQMPILGLNEDQVASVLTYVRQTWGNKFGGVTLEDVRKLQNK
jgi:nitrite reductase (NO-forming)